MAEDNREQTKKEKIIAVSGGFDPIHIGHIEMFQRAKALGDKLVVILNNDNWIKKKKGHPFMPESERMEVIKAIRYVDEVILSSHGPEPEDMSVCAELRMIRPRIFGNGGDRHSANIPEVPVCEEIGCELVYNLGSKIQSSSWLLKDYLKKFNSVGNDERQEKK